MNDIEPNELLDNILSDYSNGLYTEKEIESTALRLLGDDTRYWEIFPEWLKPLLLAHIRSFSHDDQFITFGRADPEDVRNRMIEIKKWMLANGII